MICKPVPFLLTLVAAVGLIRTASSPTRASDIYVLTNNNITTGAVNTSFGKIDTSTGVFTQISTLVPTVWNLAWNPSANNFFVSENVDTSTTLRTLTISGSLSSSIGKIGITLYGMAYRTANATLYGYDWNTDQTGSINPSTGAWSLLSTSSGLSTSSPFGGRFSIMNDTLYFAYNAASDALGTIGYSASSTVQQIGAGDPLYANMILANDGTTMYGIYGNGTTGQQRLYTINTTTGALTAGPLITGTAFSAGVGLGTRFHGAAIGPVAVPEPSIYALASLATATLTLVTHRRKQRTA